MPAGKSNGMTNDALPALSVFTFGIRPNTRGLLPPCPALHCPSLLKYQCTVKLVPGELFSVALTLTLANGFAIPGSPTCCRPSWIATVEELRLGKFCCKLAPPSTSRGSFG